MKTFLLNIPNEIRNWNNSLNAKSLLCSQSWDVFNDKGIKEVYIFQNDGTLIASHNGKVTKAKWEYIPQNTSLIIENLEADIYMLKPVCYDDKVLTLQVDGTNNFALLINDKYVQQLMLDTVAKAKLYIEEPQQFARQKAEKARQEQQEKKMALKKKKADWEDYIQKKAKEHLNSPEIKEKIVKQKKRRKFLIPIFSLLIIIYLIICSKIEVTIEFFVSFLSLLILGFGFLFVESQEYKEYDAINDMKAKYPFEKFSQQTSHSL